MYCVPRSGQFECLRLQDYQVERLLILQFYFVERGFGSPKRVKNPQRLSLLPAVRSWFSVLNLSYSLSSFLTLMIFTAGAFLLLGSRGGMDINTSKPSTT